MLEGVILKMYAEIDEYAGAFGDPINTGPVNPFEELERNDLSAFERMGMSVAVLCYLDSSIDNSTHQDALASVVAKQVNAWQKRGLLSPRQEIQKALTAFYLSEAEFLARLGMVYKSVVLPALRGKENAV